jgi:hypothetical protein
MSSVVFNPKNRILVLLIFSITLPLSNSLVYAEWTVITPPVSSSLWSLTGIHFTSTNEGWAVGSDGSGPVLLHYLCLDGSKLNFTLNGDLPLL